MSELGRRAQWRRVVVFAVLVLGIGNLAGLNYHAVDGLGGLLFILSPALVTLGMRVIGREGWQDAGFRPALRRNGQIYLAAVLLFPVMFAVSMVLGEVFGGVAFQDGWRELLVTSVLAGAVPILVYAFSEEFAWRGYLEPKLMALGLGRLQRFAVIAAIWGAWHVGYVLSQPGYSAVPLVVFFPLFFVSVFFMAVIYGVWRERTGSFWPAVVAHGVANILAWPLLEESIVMVERPMFFAARPDGLVVLMLLAGIALFALRKPPE